MVIKTQGKDEAKVNNLMDEIKASKKRKKSLDIFVKDKKELPMDKNAYVFRNGQKKDRWMLYFYDKYAETRHRFTLKDTYGNHIPPIPEAQEQAFVAGLVKFSQLKEKVDRGETIHSISVKEMFDEFLRQEKIRVSDEPHSGITPIRFRLVKSQVKWARDFLNNDKKQIYKIRRNAFDSYAVWRVEQARLYGKKDPIISTINSELGTIRRAFKSIGVGRGYLTTATMPDIKFTRRTKKVKVRDDFSDEEWLEFERSARLYFIKGRTRILDDNYTMEKHTKGKDKGLWKYRTVVTRNSTRGKNNLTHRHMFYLAMRIAADSGIRIGSLKKLKWGHIDINKKIPVEMQKEWCSVDVPAENTKTGNEYRFTAPIMRHINNLRKIVRKDLIKRDELIFVNQMTGKRWSTRIWEDYFKECLVEARLANWRKDMERGGSGGLRVDIISKKTLSFYSIRHFHITQRLKEGTPLATVARNTNTSMQYIEKHYYHYRADESVAQLAKGRERYIKPTLASTKWIRAFEADLQ